MALADGKKPRELLFDFIQEQERAGIVFEDDPEHPENPEVPENALLMGYVCICEWTGDDGERWLTILTSDPAKRHQPKWTTRGLLHEALYFWPMDG